MKSAVRTSSAADPAALPGRGWFRRNLLAALGVALVAGLAGYLGHQRLHLSEAITQTGAQLEKISETKVRLLSNYYDGLWRGAESVRTNAYVRQALAPVLSGEADAAQRARLRDWMGSQMEIFRISQLTLLDPSGQPLEILNGSQPGVGLPGPDGDLVARAFASREVIFSGLHFDPSGRHLHFSFLIPLGWDASAGRASGVVAAIFAPQDEFFELVEEKHNQWETFEAVLAEEFGGEIVFLTRLRNAPDAQGLLRLPMDTGLADPAVRAAGGHRGIVEGRDYSGAAIIAYTRRIPLINCILICKVNRAEVLAPLLAEARVFGFGVGTLVLAISLGALLLVRYYQMRHMRRQLQLTEERNRAMQTAVEIEKRFQNELKLVHSALEFSANVVVITDTGGRIVYANPAVEQLTGYTLEELTSATPAVLKSGLHTREFYEDLWQTLRAGKVWEGEFTNRHKKGHLFHEQATITPVKDDQGEITHFVAVKVDITERKKLEKQFYQALDKAVESSRMKSQFLATVSHELRTPMNGVVGMSELLLESELGDEQREMVRVIRNCSDNLMHLIEDLLDFSRIETGRFRIAEEPFDLREVVGELMQLMRPRIGNKDIRMEFNCDEQLPEQLFGDKARITQVLSNLLSNAIKFTPSGSIRIGAESRLQDTVQWLRLSVADTGIGVPESFRSRIFESFTQADGSHTRLHGGLGLGLAIAQRLVQLMKGRIGFDSEPGRGSTFWFEIEAKRPPRPARTAPPVSPAAGRPEDEPLQVLVADDDRANLLVIRRLLESLGHRAITVSNGEEALKTLAESPVDVIFLDCRMPVLDGYETTRRIREGAVAGINPDIPIIAFTASVMRENRDQCQRIGMNGFLEKPVRKVRLAEVIAACCRR